jgi:protein-S-isoprenylcysteine O-methyltransferase Ste14
MKRLPLGRKRERQMHEPPVFIYPEALLFWTIFFWIFYLEIMHSGVMSGTPNNKQDKGTHQIINVGSNISLFLAFIVAFFPWFSIPQPRIALFIGICLLVLGSILRRYSMHILGKYFTAAVTVLPNQPVIEEGPYRWIRHPGYTAGFIIFIGIGVALGNWISLMIFLLEIIIVYRLRIQAEENALIQTIGQPYKKYMDRTKRFIPFII